MKVIKQVTFQYVIPETEEERAEIEATIRSAKEDRLGRDFQLSDLRLVRPGQDLDGQWIEKPD